ncbi:hypothetical protein F4775DRAFT_582241 [Biscogniauxia sp. FL1348]|nr:hypothetical protein F4775DRAFT_582241 [Biscogniauxia sp. FL1348]
MVEHRQTPIAIVGLACRLPGNCNSPEEFWRFLLKGKVADTSPPLSRFDLKGHYDGTRRQWTMRSPGGMFIDVDPRDIDAGFFGLSQIDATSMDPQQRQLLEVVYEGVESAGLTLEGLKSKLYGCFVGSYASDYSDIQNRDPEDRTPSFTVGSGRAMLSNRISHFLDIKGPSMTIDTACSGSLISLDVACRYLHSGDADGAIVAGCNLYMSPEHNMDQSAMISAASPTGRCWTFDARADGYIKAEAVNALILKRLDDAIRDGDPIRAIIRGTSTNSDGWTPGIASPSADAQALAIKRAYERAGITKLQETAYLECHGTGTLAGDPIECRAATSIFSVSRSVDDLLRIGSVKSNIGHSEPAAGVSGILKAVLACERGIIPGNPTFEIPNPNIDFHASKLLPSKVSTPWPQGKIRRASVNSFGYGGSNAHAIVEHPDILLPGYQPTFVTSYAAQTTDFLQDDEDDDEERRLLVFSANEEGSLRSYIKHLIRHLANPTVNIQSADLAHTLAERRTRHFHRAYVVSESTRFKENQVIFGKPLPTNRIGFVFTGQGAQWPQMGRELIQNFPVAKRTIEKLDSELQLLSEPPNWSLVKELTESRSAEHLRLPEISQPLVTALQLGLLALLRDWGLKPSAVIGHSSGEIASAVAAGFLSQEEGIKVAYFRGKAAKDIQIAQTNGNGCSLSNGKDINGKKPNGVVNGTSHAPDVNPPEFGMLAVGLGPDDDALQCLDSFPRVRIACRNSPKSVTLSGETRYLQVLQDKLKADGHFARLLMVNVAYHSEYVSDIAARYRKLLVKNCPGLQAERNSCDVRFFSTVHGTSIANGCNIDYWVANMISPVLFDDGLRAMITDDSIDHLIELGPSGALAGPINQIKQAIGSAAASVEYSATLSRTTDSSRPLYDLAGKMFISGVDIDMAKVNALDIRARTIIDLPSYQWNHSVKYWHESLASRDWRYRPFPVHDLLGTKVLGTSWNAPSWRRILRLKNVPWIRDHKLGTDIVFPAAGYIAMAVEAIYQTARTSQMELDSQIDTVSKASYRLRAVRLSRALVVEEGVDHHLYLFLNPTQGQKDTWFHFKVSSLRDDVWTEHCSGLVRIGPPVVGESHSIEPFQYPISIQPWYKTMQKIGFNFGPAFQRLSEIESVPGQRASRARIIFPVPSEFPNESKYAIHPTVFDSFFQSGIPSLYQGYRTMVDTVLVPRLIDEIVITPHSSTSQNGIAVTSAAFTTGRLDKVQNYMSNVDIYDEGSARHIASVKGLHYTELNIPQASSSSLSFMRLGWKPDISLLRDEDVGHDAYLSDNVRELSNTLHLSSAAADIISLIQHKLGVFSVLDLDMCVAEESDAVHFDDSLCRPDVLRFSRYIYSAKIASRMVETQKRLQGLPGAKFYIYDAASSKVAPFKDEASFDVIILHLPGINDGTLENALKNVRDFLATDGLMILIHPSSLGEVLSTDLLSITKLNLVLKHPLEPYSPERSAGVYLCSAERASNGKALESEFSILNFSGDTSDSQSLINTLKSLGWRGVVVDTATAASRPLDVPLLIIDNPESPLLLDVTETSWNSLHDIMIPSRQVLWLTSGSQLQVSSPSNALIHGFARTLRGEEPTLTLKTLDVSSISNARTAHLIMRIIGNFNNPLHTTENEYCELNGVLYISRVFRDDRLCQVVDETKSRPPLEEMWLRENPKTVRMHCERIGAMDSLHFNQVEEDDILGPRHVEVEMRAAGLNYKDIANAMGIVPENEYLLGHEGAGVITRVGSEVDSYRVGDRVAVHSRGSFCNRVRLPKEGVFLLPDSVSFEEAATMCIVYFTVLYGLMEVAKLKRGQSILIHSATGGVGVASVQLCQYLGAEIYATAGNDEKRRFLQEKYGIPADHLFSSRTSEFAKGIRSMTRGRGVDCVLNFLTGDLLDESWRLLADNGTFVEIGKKDIIDGNTISMEPFDRNCTYRGIDISQQSLLDDLQLVERILQTVRQLLVANHIRPISPRKVFSFSQIPDAMRYMRSGEHIGKIVISDGEAEDVKVPTRKAPISLNLDPKVAYLMVGGFKGLCGSLAEYMARCGARNIISFSRSGTGDERSQRVVHILESMGTKVQVCTGDVSDLKDVTRLFQESTLPIAGIIQGAMVLRDKTFEAMTVQDYHDALACKVSGTWNLHIAAEQAHQKLSFFTMLSSISGFVGTAGQANYAAGNSFQDAFASYRHSLGLAAHTVDLGIIEDVGYMSEHQSLTDRVQSRSRLSAINEKQLHEVVKLSILQQTADDGRGLNPDSRSQMVTGLPFPLHEDSPVLGDMRFRTLLMPHSDLEHDGSGTGSDSISTFKSMIAASLPSEQLIPEAVKLVNEQIVRMLGLTSAMEESKPLNSYGMDSLAAVDLRNWFKLQLGVGLTTLDILNAGSLKALCTKAVERLIG